MRVFAAPVGSDVRMAFATSWNVASAMSCPRSLPALVTPNMTLPSVPFRQLQRVSIPPCNSPVVFLNSTRDLRASAARHELV
jgi:hypothetical protein